MRHGISAGDARRLLRSGRHERARLAYRDVASATNRLTLIAAILPADCVSTHTVFCLRTPLPADAQHLLCGLFNSFVVNYLVRLRVTTHVTTGTVEQLPIPTAESAPAACQEIAALARLLAKRRDPDALARLNARVAELVSAERGRVRTRSRDVPADIGQRASAGVKDISRRGTERREHTEMNQPQSHRGTEIEEPGDLTSRIIGAAIDVHKALGPGLLESIYEAAMCIELEDRGMLFVRHSEYPRITRAVRLARTRST